MYESLASKECLIVLEELVDILGRAAIENPRNHLPAPLHIPVGTFEKRNENGVFLFHVLEESKKDFRVFLALGLAESDFLALFQ